MGEKKATSATTINLNEKLGTDLSNWVLNKHISI